MFANPVKEIISLRTETLSRNNIILRDSMLLDAPKSDFLDIDLSIEPGLARVFALDIHGATIEFITEDQTIEIDGDRPTLLHTDRNPTIALKNGALQLRILIDRGSVEVFANGGETAIFTGHLFEQGNYRFGLCAEGGEVKIPSLSVSALKSVW